jgi:hypothetical protein
MGSGKSFKSQTQKTIGRNGKVHMIDDFSSIAGSVLPPLAKASSQAGMDSQSSQTAAGLFQGRDLGMGAANNDTGTFRG